MKKKFLVYSLVFSIISFLSGCGKNRENTKILDPNYIETRGKWEKLNLGNGVENTSINYTMYKDAPTACMLSIGEFYGMVVLGASLIYVGKESSHSNAKYDTTERTVVFQTNDPSRENNHWLMPVDIDKTTLIVSSLDILKSEEYGSFLNAFLKSTKLIMKVNLANDETVSFEFNISGLMKYLEAEESESIGREHIY